MNLIHIFPLGFSFSCLDIRGREIREDEDRGLRGYHKWIVAGVPGFPVRLKREE